LIDLQTVDIQLPTSENDFMFFRPVGHSDRQTIYTNLLSQVLTHDSPELGHRIFPLSLPPGENVATFGHLVKLSKIWGEITRWAFEDVDDPSSRMWTAQRTASARLLLTQWELELPNYSKWCYENYASHSVPGVALGGCFVFMHLLSRTGFVLLGHKILDSVLNDSQTSLVDGMTSAEYNDVSVTFRKVWFGHHQILVSTTNHALCRQ
jgi:hypothetical protein